MSKPRQSTGVRKPRIDKSASAGSRVGERINVSPPVEFGVEGSNKTIPVPQLDANSVEMRVNTSTKHIEKSPYTRG